MNVIVLGSINTDLVINASRLPKIGETISGSGFSVNCGGKGANQAVAAAKLGADVTFIGAVGNDTNGDISIENLKANDIETNRILRTDINTGVAVITVCNGDNCIVLDSGANSAVSRDVIDNNIDIISNSDMLIMQLEIPLDTVMYAAKKAHAAGVKVVLNPAPIVSLSNELLQNTDILILNETEAEALTSIYPDAGENGKESINLLMGLGVKQVIITLGAAGSIYNIGSEVTHMPAYKTDVVDTTAAGDTFIGAFCTNINKGIEHAVRYATAAAAITVSRRGASCSIPTKDEAECFLQKRS